MVYAGFFSLHAKYDCVWNYISLNCKSATTAILLKKNSLFVGNFIYDVYQTKKKNSWQEFVQSETSCTINEKNIFFKEVLPK